MQVPRRADVLGVQVVRAEAACRRRAPVVDDLARAELALLLEQDPGRRFLVDDDPRGVDALAAREVDNVLAEFVVADPAEPADPVAEPLQADREVRLGPGAVAGERVGEAQRTLLDRGEQHHRLAERDDVHAYLTRAVGRMRSLAAGG
jgi:hypothetical protein